MYCIHCGSQNHLEANFCNSCGKPTNQIQPPPVQAMQMTPVMQAYTEKLAPRPMNFGQAVKSAFTKFAVFKGRASRSEYWYFALFANISPYLMAYLAMYIRNQSYSNLYYNLSFFIVYTGIAVLIASLIPSLACAVRRLHDTGHSGGALFLGLIPIIGSIILFVWLISPGEPVVNKYGPASI